MGLEVVEGDKGEGGGWSVGLNWVLLFIFNGDLDIRL